MKFVFAYANSQERPLNNLTNEQNALDDLFSPYANKAPFDYKCDGYGNLTRIKDFFKTLGDVKVFHFGGHSSPEGIQLGQSGNYIGTAELIALFRDNIEREMMHLIFLNGCTNYNLVNELKKCAKVIIATKSNVGDELAKDFAHEFYKKFLNGFSIINSFKLTHKSIFKKRSFDYKFNQPRSDDLAEEDSDKSGWHIFYTKKEHLNITLDIDFECTKLDDINVKDSTQEWSELTHSHSIIRENIVKNQKSILRLYLDCREFTELENSHNNNYSYMVASLKLLPAPIYQYFQQNLMEVFMASIDIGLVNNIWYSMRNVYLGIIGFMYRILLSELINAINNDKGLLKTKYVQELKLDKLNMRHINVRLIIGLYKYLISKNIELTVSELNKLFVFENKFNILKTLYTDLFQEDISNNPALFYSSLKRLFNLIANISFLVKYDLIVTDDVKYLSGRRHTKFQLMMQKIPSNGYIEHDESKPTYLEISTDDTGIAKMRKVNSYCITLSKSNSPDSVPLILSPFIINKKSRNPMFKDIKLAYYIEKDNNKDTGDVELMFSTREHIKYKKIIPDDQVEPHDDMKITIDRIQDRKDIEPLSPSKFLHFQDYIDIILPDDNTEKIK